MADEAPDGAAFNRIKRLPDRAHYREETVWSVVDECLICHVAFKLDDDDEQARQEWPVVIPMGFGRIEDRIYLHGHLQSRLLKALSEGRTQVCMTFTTINSLVLARSAFHNSFRYRSAVVFGTATLIPASDTSKKVAALTAVTNQPFKLVGGDRWNDCRPATDAELKSTRVVEVQVELTSAKVAVGGPNDDKADIEDPEVRDGVWAGEVMLRKGYSGVKHSAVAVKAPVPDYVERLLTLAPA